MIRAEKVFFGLNVRKEIVRVTGRPLVPAAVAVTVKRRPTPRAHLVRHTVPFARRRPVTRSPPERTRTFVIRPPAARTVIPRFGAESVPPPGVIVNRTASVGRSAVACPPCDRVAPPPQPAARRASAAQRVRDELRIA